MLTHAWCSGSQAVSRAQAGSRGALPPLQAGPAFLPGAPSPGGWASSHCISAGREEGSGGCPLVPPRLMGKKGRWVHQAEEGPAPRP